MIPNKKSLLITSRIQKEKLETELLPKFPNLRRQKSQKEFEKLVV